MANNIFMFFCYNFSGKFITEYFPNTRRIGFFCFMHLCKVLAVDVYVGNQYKRKTFYSLTIEYKTLENVLNVTERF